VRIALVAGARPNFVKIAPIQEALRGIESVEAVVVHTGQHYDDPMSAAFFRELSIPEPDYMLGVGSAPHAVQTARIMEAFDGLLDAEPFDLVVVVGDVNSTVACSLTAVKRSIPVAHVEAGLRSFDWSMPEEINRIVTDAVSTLLFTPSRDANENLGREGKKDDEIFFVGNVMVDTLLKFRDEAEQRSQALARFDVAPGEYCIMTLHRPANVDDHSVFDGVLGALAEIGARMPIVYPMHPRSRKMMEAGGLLGRAERTPGLILSGPLGYLDFVGLVSQARFAMTDSGGVQEETTVLGVPCLTLRPNTERPVTITEGTNELVGTDPPAIVEAALRIMDAGEKPEPRLPELWDGRASERIAAVLSGRE
jgi:UDP-N-acetylglucosamine 2-epimerase (non-hydrolysing)